MKLSSLVSSGMLMNFNGVPLYAFEGDSLLHKIAKNSLNDKVLVLIEMHGGNDGLNTVIPIINMDFIIIIGPILQSQKMAYDSIFPLIIVYLITDKLVCIPI